MIRKVLKNKNVQKATEDIKINNAKKGSCMDMCGCGGCGGC